MDREGWFGRCPRYSVFELDGHGVYSTSSTCQTVNTEGAQGERVNIPMKGMLSVDSTSEG